MNRTGPLLCFLATLLLALALGCGSTATTSPTKTADAAVVPAASDSAPPIVKTKGGTEMVLIPAGSFEMGSRGHEGETPHAVKLDAFYMDRTEATQDMFEKLSFRHASHFRNPSNPVEMIPWSQAALFCNARSKAEGFTPCYDEKTAECNFAANGYRMPTEAEWEYACRAGTDKAYSFGADPRNLAEHAWSKENSGNKTHAVAQRRPNPWGLYDMHGNVAEWCNDVYEKDYYKSSPAENPRGPADGAKYVLRGGAWESGADALRSTARGFGDPGFQDACFKLDAIGFRCVRKVEK